MMGMALFNLLLVTSLLVLLLTHSDAAKKSRKCSRRLKRIPMQKKFDMAKFAGTWYTISRTKYVWKDNTYESASIEFSENADGSYTYSLTGQLDNKCLPVETGALKQGPRKGQFILRGPEATPANPTMVVSYTDYNTALVYYCFRYRPGRKDQCKQGSMQAEILSRSTKPKKRMVKDYLKRMAKRLCVSPKHSYATKPGVCKIPDILAQAKERDINEDNLIGDVNKKHCAVNNIPIQKDFQLPEMGGLWYEIARTRFTFNKMESVISYHRYDSDKNVIKSFYTGTINGNCSTPIQGTSKTKNGAEHIGDMEGKIEGESYVWSPLKILYVDANYLMFYACYSGDSDFPCIKEWMEVTLVGRTRQIPEGDKANIYTILPSICIDPADMIDTKFEENCTQWVENVIRETDMDPSSCSLDGILAYNDFDDISMLGEWFLYAHINYTNSDPVMGNVINITRGPVQSFVIKHATFDENSCQCMNNIYSRQRCLDTGDYVTTIPSENKSTWGYNFWSFGINKLFLDSEEYIVPLKDLLGEKGSVKVFSKILYQDDNTFVSYICTQRNLDGHCNKEGVYSFIYTRNKTLTEMSEEQVSKALKSACMRPDDMMKIKDSHSWKDNIKDWTGLSLTCSRRAVVAGQNGEKQVIIGAPKTHKVKGLKRNWCELDVLHTGELPPADDMCDIDNIAIFNDFDDFDQTKIYGYWYEIAHSPGIHNGNMESFTAYFTSDTNVTLQIYYCGSLKNGSLVPVERITALPRCLADLNGDYLTEIPKSMRVSDAISFIPMKVLFTDYDVLLTFICQELLPNGHCSDTGSHVRLWSRNMSMDDDTREYIMDFASWACIEEEFALVDTVHNDSVYPKLEEYVLENLFETGFELTEEEISNEANDQKIVGTEPLFDDFEDDLQRYLDMDDDEFYAADK